MNDLCCFRTIILILPCCTINIDDSTVGKSNEKLFERNENVVVSSCKLKKKKNLGGESRWPRTRENYESFREKEIGKAAYNKRAKCTQLYRFRVLPSPRRTTIFEAGS